MEIIRRLVFSLVEFYDVHLALDSKFRTQHSPIFQVILTFALEKEKEMLGFKPGTNTFFNATNSETYTEGRIFETNDF